MAFSASAAPNPTSTPSGPPKWIDRVPDATATTLYFVGSAEEGKLDAALEQASHRALGQIAEYVGVSIKSEYISARENLEKEVREVFVSTAETPEPLARATRRETHHEATLSGYRASVLMSVPRDEVDRLCERVRQRVEEERKALSASLEEAVAKLGLKGTYRRVVAVDFQEARRGRSGELGAYLRREVLALVRNRATLDGVSMIEREAIPECAKHCGVRPEEIVARIDDLRREMKSDLVIAGTYARSGEDRVELVLAAATEGGKVRTAKLDLPAGKLPALSWVTPAWLPRSTTDERVEQVILHMLDDDEKTVAGLVRDGISELKTAAGTPQKTFKRAARALLEGRPASAAQLFDAFIGMPAGGRPEALTLLGIARIRSRLPARDALQAFDAALQQDEGIPEAHLAAAACWLALGRGDKAWDHLEKLEEMGR